MTELHRKRKKLYLDPTYDRRMLSAATRRKWNKIRDAVLPRILSANKEGSTFHSVRISYIIFTCTTFVGTDSFCDT